MGYYKYAATPTFRGYDSYYGYYSGAEDYFSHMAGSYGGAGYDFHQADSPNCGANCSRVVWEAKGVYSTHLFASRAESIINAHDPDKNALFLYMPFQAVHVPDQVFRTPTVFVCLA